MIMLAGLSADGEEVGQAVCVAFLEDHSLHVDTITHLPGSHWKQVVKRSPCEAMPCTQVVVVMQQCHWNYAHPDVYVWCRNMCIEMISSNSIEDQVRVQRGCEQLEASILRLNSTNFYICQIESGVLHQEHGCVQVCRSDVYIEVVQESVDGHVDLAKHGGLLRHV